MHCEAALAAFAKFGPGAPATCDPPDDAMDALRQLSAVMFPCAPLDLPLIIVYTVSASQGSSRDEAMLSRLLGAYGCFQGSRRTQIHGPRWPFHGLSYRTAAMAPPCREMVHRFRKHLRSQLKIMLDNTASASDLRIVVEAAAAAAKKHHQNLSIESESALITASSATDASAPNIADDSDATPLNASRLTERRRPPPAGPDLPSPG